MIAFPLLLLFSLALAGPEKKANTLGIPAAVVTAGMISLGFATRYPELPRDSLEKVLFTTSQQPTHTV
jgi:hypothetical protein